MEFYGPRHVGSIPIARSKAHQNLDKTGLRLFTPFLPQPRLVTVS